MTFSNGPMSSLQKGAVQPPNWKSPVGSSTGPPGACMIPSSERNTAPVSLRIGGLAVGRGLDLGDVDLLHRHHRLECPPGTVAALGREFDQQARRDLPGKAPSVLAPAAHALFAAIFGDGVPQPVGLFLVVGQDDEAHGLVRLEVRPAVETDERL